MYQVIPTSNDLAILIEVKKSRTSNLIENTDIK